MLKLLRKKGVAKKILWVVAVIIIISFGFFGTAYLITSNKNTQYAGEIFGKKISLEDFDRVYRQVRNQKIMTLGDNFRKMRASFNLEAETWDWLILLQEAQKRLIKISDDTVVNTIQQIPFFQRDGQFDPLLYKDILGYVFEVNPREFEEGIRDFARIGKLFNNVTSSIELNEEDVWNEFKKENEKVQISYISILPESFKNEVNVIDEEAASYFKDRPDDFLVPPTINVAYISIDFPEKPTDEEKGKLQLKGQEIYEALSKDQNLDTVAKKYELTVKTTGFFSMDQPNLSLGWSYDLLNKIFQYSIGQISEPFESTTAIHIVKLTDKKEEHRPEYAEVKDKVHEALAKVKARGIAQQKAEALLKSIQNAYFSTKLEDFGKTAKSLNLEAAQTPLFNRGLYLPKIGISREFEEASFALNEQNKISNVVETSNGFYILHLDNYVPAEKEEFLKKKDSVAQKIYDQKRNEAFSEFMTTLRLKANLVDHISKKKNQAL